MSATLTEHVEAEHAARRGSQSLALLAQVARRATTRPELGSVALQFAGAARELAEYLWVRGESGMEHYYAEALALACVEPATSDVRGYEMLLLTFARFDRRHPSLPPVEPLLPLKLREQHCIHFVQALRSQSAFQSCYEAARQIETYGAMDRSQKKSHRIILLSRELTGQPLLGGASPHEQMYVRLATQNG